MKSVLALSASLLLLAACSKETLKPVQNAEAAKPPVVAAKEEPKAEEKKDETPHVAQAVTNMLGLDSEIVRLCGLHFDVAPSEEGAPRFDTDESELSSQDTAILQQVATCLTNGPLAGKNVHLIGRADSRGTTEYNMVLGEHRANAVGHYLEEKGVNSARVNETSRGELDATGSDDTTMRNDRRVDIMLGS
jgi:peptidoglycan-associated lipoprotein